jgi:hypothetical protein
MRCVLCFVLALAASVHGIGAQLKLSVDALALARIDSIVSR